MTNQRGQNTVSVGQSTGHPGPTKTREEKNACPGLLEAGMKKLENQERCCEARHLHMAWLLQV